MTARHSPRTVIVASLALLFAALAAMLMLRLQLYDPGLSLVADEAGGIRVQAVDRHSVNAGTIARGDRMVAFHTPDGVVAAQDLLLIEEPDVLPNTQAYMGFLSDQQRLHSALAAGRLQAELADGRRLPLLGELPTWNTLPFLFWMQLFIGFAGVLTTIVVWSVARPDISTRLYVITGIGVSLAALTAAVYSTRDLGMPAGWIRGLSIFNHLGAQVFTAALASLLFVYPRRLGRHQPVVAACFTASMTFWLLDSFQINGFFFNHLGILLIFSLSFVFAFMQWRQTRDYPADRAALRWFLMTIYLGTGLFAGLIIIPAAIGLPFVIPQSFMFAAFLIMFWGLSLGVARYRLFKLESWWRSIWAWLLSGLAIILLDLLLIGLLDMSGGMALSVSVAVVGWLYFPVRQWLWGRLGAGGQRGLVDWLPEILPLLIAEDRGPDQEARLLQRWPLLLEVVFRPLAIQRSDGEAPRMLDDGLALVVPDINEDEAPWELRHADGGRRLFNDQDLANLAILKRLFALTLDLCHARDEGARLERVRIARDVHDDLGAKLLTLLYHSPEASRPLVREAIQDSRDLINVLSQEAITLEAAAARWHAEAWSRLEAAGLRKSWQTTGCLKGFMLSARQFSNLTRVLREALTNVLKHAGAGMVALRVERRDDVLLLSVEDDGHCDPAALAAASGRGLLIMRTRSEELGASLSLACTPGCRVVISLPLAALLSESASESASGHALARASSWPG